MSSLGFVVYCTFCAGVFLWIAFFAVVERDKLAGLPSGIWLSLRALLYVALLAIWAPAVAATIGHLVEAAETSAADSSMPVSYAAGGAGITVCIALAVTVVVLYLYRSLWQLSAVQPRLRQRPRGPE
jgi:hypothetical protein